MDKRLIFFILAASSAIGALPALLPPGNPFFASDPDSIYITNAFLYLSQGRIFMIDHPGTPLVTVLSIVYLPLKLVATIQGLNPVSYMVQNFDLVTWIARVTMVCLFILGSFIFQVSVYKIFKNILVNIFLWTAFFLIPDFLSIPIRVIPEVTGYLTTSVWLYVTANYLERKQLKYLIYAALIAGITIASKYNFIFLAPITLLFLFFNKSKEFDMVQSIKNLAGGALTIAIGFSLGTILISNHWKSLAYWLFRYIFLTGQFGHGSLGVVNNQVLVNQFHYWIGQSVLLQLGVLLLLIYFLTSLKDMFWALFIIPVAASFVAFMKYPSSHYQFPTLVMLTIFASLIFSKLGMYAKLIILSFLLCYTTYYLSTTLRSSKDAYKKHAVVKVVSEEISNEGILISLDVPTGDYALMRTTDWSYQFFNEALYKYKPSSYVLDGNDLTQALNPKGDKIKLVDLQWNGIIIPKSLVGKFIKANGDKSEFNIQNIQDTGYVAIYK